MTLTTYTIYCLGQEWVGAIGYSTPPLRLYDSSGTQINDSVSVAVPNYVFFLALPYVLTHLKQNKECKFLTELLVLIFKYRSFVSDSDKGKIVTLLTYGCVGKRRSIAPTHS
jgi:hypothetical protein